MGRQPRILFIHYRTGERDGVSLEIENRARILTELGAEVNYLSGFDGMGRDNAKVIPLIDLRASFNTFLRENAFYHRLFDETTMLFIYSQLENKFATRIEKYLSALKPDLIFVHNVFSHAYNLPFSTALLKVLDRYQYPTVSVNHDFWFEREQFRHPKYGFVRTVLESLPPNRPYITQQTINTRADKEVRRRRGFGTQVIGDHLDFDQNTSPDSKQRQVILDDLNIDPGNLVILHATRVTGRKAIELAISYTAMLQKKLRKISRPFSYRSKTISAKTKLTLLFPNFVEVDAVPYWNMLKEYAHHLGVDAVWAYDRFSLLGTAEDGATTYSYWDSYSLADLVTYTSVEEGFGNQLLEAICYRKLPVVFEYPVYLQDIKREGYHIVSLGEKTRSYNGRVTVPPEVLVQAADQTLAYLQSPTALNSLTENNYNIARTNHSMADLRVELQKLLTSLVKS